MIAHQTSRSRAREKTSSKIPSETSKNFLSDVYKWVQKEISGVKWFKQLSSHFTLSGRRSLLYRAKSIDLLRKTKDWFLFDKDIRPERVNSLELNARTLHSISFFE